MTGAILGAPAPANCDVTATLNSLTLTPSGQLNLISSNLTVTSTDIQRDGIMGSGGPTQPIFTNAGTFRKSAGTGLYTIDPGIIFNSQPGSVIQVDSGSLQLPGVQGLFDTVTFNTAAGTLIDLVSPYGNSGGQNLFQGTLTNTTGVGTVRLSTDQMRDNYHGDGKCTLNFPGSVFQWVGGIMGGTGSGEVPVFTNVGTMNLSGGGTKYCQAFINNQHLMIQSGAGNLDIGGYHIVTNAAGATYDLQSDAGTVTTSSGAIANAGLFKKSAGTGTSTISTFFSHLGGTVEVDSGTLLLPTAQDPRPALSTGGNFVVAANALLDLGSGEPFGGTYTGSGAGTVRMSAGIMYGDLQNHYPTTFNFPAGLFQWTGGTIGDYSGELFTNAGTINLPGASGVSVVAQFTNAGTMIQTGAGGFNGGGGASLLNAVGALFDLRSDAGIGGFSYSSSYTFTNAGTLRKSAGTGTSTVSSIFTNTGTVTALTGTLDFSTINYSAPLRNGTLSSGTWTVASGAALTFSAYPNGFAVNQGTVVLNGANAQFPAINALTDNQGTFSLLAQRQFTSAGALSNEGTLNLDAGSTLHVSGAYTGSGASSVAFTVGGTQSQGAQSAGVLQVNGAATLGGTLSVKLGAGVQLKATDSITVMAATGGLGGSFANVVNGERVNTSDGTGSFQVNYGSDSPFNAKAVVLSGWVASGVVAHPAFFTGEAALGSGVYYLGFNSGKYFGYYSYLTDPHYIYHFDLGYEYWFDAKDGADGLYFYDFKSNGFFYTSPTFPFPYLYDFSLNSVVYYYPDPNNAGRYNTNGYRFFYVFNTGKIISK